MATKQQQVKRAAGRAGSAARGRSGSAAGARGRAGQGQQQRHERRGEQGGAFLTIRLPLDLRDAAQARAGSDGLDVSFVVRELLREYAAGRLSVAVQVVRQQD